MSFDNTCWKLAKEAGLGKNPDQVMLASYQLGIARTIARKVMPWDKENQKTAPVDAKPGCELAYTDFKPLWADAMKKYSDFLATTGMPYMVWSVDEPREVPNAWNRTVKDTSTYLDWMGEIGIKNRMVTPMADTGGGVDNIVLVDHCDIITPHGNKSCAGLFKAAYAKGKILHIYNTGMSRLSWGFMVWRDGAKGRWEWHWSFGDNSLYEGYPGTEWYCPFTRPNEYATNAPIAEYPGGVVYKSAMMNIVQGINDFAYLVTLESTAAEMKKAGKNAAAVAKAESLLNEIRSSIPEFPIDEKFDETSAKLSLWRSQIAEVLKTLSN